MAVTIKYNKGGELISARTGSTSKSSPGICTLTNTYDSSVFGSNTATGTYLAPVATDIVELIAIPANCKVLDVVITLMVAGLATSTVGVGLAGGSEFLAAFALTGAVGTGDTAVADSLSMAAASGQIFQSADTIDLVFNTATPTTAVVKVDVLVWMFSSDAVTY